MTVDGDRRYFAAHPEYHGLLHPEIPNYEAQVAARDRMLERHPTLRVVGCHLGSLEYDVDELAKRLDKYPNLAVDLSARIVHLQIQPRDKVRAFLVKYQDRLLYGTDVQFGRGSGAAGRGPGKGAGAAGCHLRVGRDVARDGSGTGAGERADGLQVARRRAARAGVAEDLLRERAEVGTRGCELGTPAFAERPAGRLRRGRRDSGTRVRDSRVEAKAGSVGPAHAGLFTVCGSALRPRRHDRRRRPLQVAHERVRRHAVAARQVFDVLVDRAVAERHEVRVGDGRDRGHQVARLDDARS